MPSYEWSQDVFPDDESDLLIEQCARLLKCEAYLSTLLLAPFAYIREEKQARDLSAEEIRAECERVLDEAVGVIYHSARASKRLDRRFTRLLSRVGRFGGMALRPALFGRVARDPRFPWPKEDPAPSRRDLFHFYVLLRCEYLRLKGQLLGRPLTDADGSVLAELAEKILGIPIPTTSPLEEFRRTTVESWAAE